ncbi:MAG: glycosyl transferase family 36 [Candidatus Hydrogenedentota bacterium]
MKYKSEFGYFSNDLKEYHITSPDTPRPWANVISNPDYGFVITQSGCGFSFYQNSNLNRITRFEQDLIDERSGKFLFIYDSLSNDLWSLTPRPCLAKYDDYKCIHGIGYTIIKTVRNGVLCEVSFFVSKDRPYEIWKVRLQNSSNKSRSLFVASYLEWLLGPWPDSHREFHKLFIKTWFFNNSIFATKRIFPSPQYKEAWNTPWPFVAFHSVSQKVSSYSGDKEVFIGKTRKLSDPESIRRNNLGNSVGNHGDGIASLGLKINLKPKQTLEFSFILGVSETLTKANSIIKTALTDTDKIIEESLKYFQAMTCNPQIKTPNDDINALVNYWLPYQTISARLCARSGYYQSSGAIGFRDQLQDSQIFLPSKPEKTKNQILLHARHQFSDGRVYHWWHPDAGVGPKSEFSDDLLWLGFVTFNYLKETGDFNILDKTEAYVDKGRDSLLNHILKAINLVIKRRSKRGLPLIGEGDWNDGLSSAGDKWKGESIWMSMFLYYILSDLIVVLTKINKTEKIPYYKNVMKKLKIATNKYAWDGNWYLRATTDEGEIIGSKRCRDGKIFLNPQIWSILSGLIPQNRKPLVIKSIKKYLDRKYGCILLYPAYKSPDSSIGYLTRYAPGTRENGGLYTHAGVWALWMACFIKDKEWAYALYQKFSPVLRGLKAQKYFVEPYVTAGNVDGPDSPNFGRGSWTWYTGSSAWLHRILCEWFLGIRPDWDGLVIDPCVPDKWNSFSIKRIYRNKICNIVYKKSEKKGIYLNGRKIRGNIIKPDELKYENEIVIHPF